MDYIIRKKERMKHLQQRQGSFATSRLHVLQEVRLILRRKTTEKKNNQRMSEWQVSVEGLSASPLTMMRTWKGFPGCCCCCLSILLSRS